MSWRTPPNCTIIDKWVFESFALADEPLTKDLQIFETPVSVNNNLCEKLVASLEFKSNLRKDLKLLQFDFYCRF